MSRLGTLLCVDDDPGGLKMRKVMLENFGFDVCTSTSGREALDLFHSRRFDAVVVDYQMPGMNGSQVASELRRINPKIPILMLSAYTSLPESVTRAVNAFASKTEPISMLVGKIEQLLPPRNAADPVWWLGLALAVTALTGLAVQKLAGPDRVRRELPTAMSQSA